MTKLSPHGVILVIPPKDISAPGTPNPVSTTSSLTYVGPIDDPQYGAGYQFQVQFSASGFDGSSGPTVYIVGGVVGGGHFSVGTSMAKVFPSAAPYSLVLNGSENSTNYASMPNGELFIFLTPLDIDKLSKQDRHRLEQYFRGDPVQLATGSETRHRTLFSFNGARKWDFTLSYNSLLGIVESTVMPLGRGWSHNFQASLVASGDGNLIVQWDATSQNVFTPVSGDPNTFVSTEDGARYDKITVQSDGMLLTNRDQSSLLFNSSGQLIEDRDPQGRKLLISYTGGLLNQIRDPVSDNSVTFGYDSDGMLTTVTDGTGASVVLGYQTQDIVEFLLNQITDQNGHRTTFDHDSNLQITAISDDTGAAVLKNTNDNTGRVISQQNFINTSQTATFGYSRLGAIGTTLYAASDTQHLVPLVLTSPQQMSVTNSAGQTVTYTLDSMQRLSTATLNGQTTTLSYDVTTGLAASITDPAGVTTPVPDYNVTAFTDHDGKRTIFTFDDNFNMIAEQDALGFVTTYTYDANNQLTSLTDPLGRTTSYTYDASGNVLTKTDPAGKVSTFTYDARNNLLTTTDPANQVTNRTYDSNNNLLTLTDALGQVTTWTYDANSLPLTMTLPRGGVYHYVYTNGLLTQSTDPNGVATNFDYDADGRLLHRTDALAKVTTYTYDAHGNVLTAKNALNQTTTYTYDFRNRVHNMTDPAGAVTTYTYDNDSNILTSTDALGKVTTYTYDGEDRLKTTIDALNRTTAYAYDSNGRLASVTDPGNNVTRYSYDAAGRLTTVIDALGKHTTSGYDARGLLASVTDPLIRTSNFTYDDVGRRHTATDPLGRQTSFGYDALNRLAQVTDPGRLVAQQGFDSDGNRTSLTNPASAATAFAYDAGGRLTTTTTPAGHATGYAYDARGLPYTVTLPSGHQTTLLYDDAGRLSSATDPVGTIAYGRDADGRVLTVTEGSKVLTRVYDSLGRLTSYTDGDGNVIGYLYDDIGRLKTLTYPDGKQVNYAYDSAGRLSTVTDWAGRVTTYTYDADGRMTQLLRPNGTKQVRQYDAAGQLTQLTELAPDGTTVIYSGNHGYDAAGQLTGETLVPATIPQTTNVGQTFDADNRLLTHNGAATTFDADGNLLSIASGVAPASYAYDARNRLTSAGGLTYTYNAENRRIALTDGTGTTGYTINPNATLDQVLVRTLPDGTKTFYVYGLGLLHEETAGAPKYYHCDRRGDTVAITDATGVITDRASYGIYGELLTRTGSTNTPFLFNGEWGVQTDASGIYYHRTRYYHPGLRRFLNQDIVFGSVSEVPTLNRFAYAGNNPIVQIDPSGLDFQTFAGMRYDGSSLSSLNANTPRPANYSTPNPSGHGIILFDSGAAYYFGLGGGGGTQVVLLDNGQLVSYAYAQIGVGAGGAGVNAGGGEVFNVYKPSDYEGAFKSASGGPSWIGGSYSWWPQGASSWMAGVSTPGIAVTLQAYDIIGATDPIESLRRRPVDSKQCP